LAAALGARRDLGPAAHAPRPHVVLTRNAACERVYRASADAARVQTQTLQTSVCSLTVEG